MLFSYIFLHLSSVFDTPINCLLTFELTPILISTWYLFYYTYPTGQNRNSYLGAVPEQLRHHSRDILERDTKHRKRSTERNSRKTRGIDKRKRHLTRCYITKLSCNTIKYLRRCNIELETMSYNYWLQDPGFYTHSSPDSGPHSSAYLA